MLSLVYPIAQEETPKLVPAPPKAGWTTIVSNPCQCRSQWLMAGRAGHVPKLTEDSRNQSRPTRLVLPATYCIAEASLPLESAQQVKQGMPNFRRKACHQCRSSKLACDRKQPRCSRCERRRRQCWYSAISEASRVAIDETHNYQETPSATLECVSNDDRFAYTQAADFSVSSGPGENHEGFEWSSETCNIDERLWFGSGFPDYPSTPPATAAFDTNPDIVTDIIADINTEISKRANFEHSSLADHDLLLRPRRSRTAEANLTSKVMLGTIQSYPEMLIDGLRLPPFISPPCCGDEVQCQQSGHHQCLLPPFAACASIIRISQAGLSQNRDFIWRTIYIEQQKLFHEYESYNKEMLLAAVQVVVLYTVLYISEAALVPKHYLKSVAQTLGTMMNSMLSLVDVGRFGQPDIIPGRHEWIYNESVRRVTAFCYAMNELLNIAIRTSSSTNACKRVHLPSTRTLWAAKTNIEWQRQYAGQASRRQFKESLKIAHLRGYTMHLEEGSTRKGWMTDFETWCMDHDELGTLVWMATKLDPA